MRSGTYKHDNDKSLLAARGSLTQYRDFLGALSLRLLSLFDGGVPVCNVIAQTVKFSFSEPLTSDHYSKNVGSVVNVFKWVCA